ncbi:glycosyltransferase family 4 protein [Spirosoma arcticum]
MAEKLKKIFCADVRMINNSGIGVYIRHFIRALLADSMCSVILIGRSKELNAYFQPDAYKHIEADFPIYSIIEQLKLPLLVPACDVFWSPHYNIPLLPIRARRRLATVPDVFHLAHLETLTTAQKVYAQVVTKAAARQSDRVTTISQFSTREIVRLTGIKDAKIKVILLGMDTDLFHRAEDETVRQRVQRNYNLPDQYILFVGNVKPNKNLRRLVDGFAKLPAELSNLKLVITGKREGFITGDPALFARIRADQVLADRIVFTGFVDGEDLPVLYSLATLFAFPSIYEGFGFPPLEAMACGCPVVASNASSIPEICGTAAFYVDPTNPDDIARGLQEVLTNSLLREELIKAGKQHVLMYDWLKSERQFVQQVYQLANEQ